MPRTLTRRHLRPHYYLHHVLTNAQQYLSEHIGTDTYLYLYDLLDKAVKARNIAPAALADADAGGNKAPARPEGFISPSVEPRFVAFRHWNLYDAMYYSDYIAVNLETWKEERGQYDAGWRSPGTRIAIQDAAADDDATPADRTVAMRSGCKFSRLACSLLRVCLCCGGGHLRTVVHVVFRAHCLQRPRAATWEAARSSTSCLRKWRFR